MGGRPFPGTQRPLTELDKRVKGTQQSLCSLGLSLSAHPPPNTVLTGSVCFFCVFGTSHSYHKHELDSPFHGSLPTTWPAEPLSQILQDHPQSLSSLPDSCYCKLLGKEKRGRLNMFGEVLQGAVFFWTMAIDRRYPGPSDFSPVMSTCQFYLTRWFQCPRSCPHICSLASFLLYSVLRKTYWAVSIYTRFLLLLPFT